MSDLRVELAAFAAAARTAAGSARDFAPTPRIPQEMTMSEQPSVVDPQEPDHPAAYALAKHIADHPIGTVQAAFRYLNTGLTLEARDQAAPAPAPAGRAAVSANLWAVAEHHVIAEWICCEPVKPQHDLCVQGDAALRMVKSLLVDDPKAARPAPLLDAVLAVLPAADHRLALSEALGLGTGAPWDAIQERAAELSAADLPAPADRPAVLREGADAIDATFTGPDTDRYVRYGADLLRRLADEAQHSTSAAPASRRSEWCAAADALDAGTARFIAEWPDERDSQYFVGRRDAAAYLRTLAAKAGQPELGCTCDGPLTSTTLPSGTTYEEHRRTCAVLADEAQQPAPADRGTVAAIDETAATIQAEAERR